MHHQTWREAQLLDLTGRPEWSRLTKMGRTIVAYVVLDYLEEDGISESQTTMAAKLGLERDDVNEHHSRAVALGLLTRHIRPGKSNVYALGSADEVEPLTAAELECLGTVLQRRRRFGDGRPPRSFPAGATAGCTSTPRFDNRRVESTRVNPAKGA